MLKTEDIYNQRYQTGYRDHLSGYEIARWSALKHFSAKTAKVSSAEKVLDYGSGSGLHVGLWKEIFFQSGLYFADISSVALDKLKENFPEYQNNVCLIKDDKTHFDDNTFDVVVSIEVMEHVVDLPAYVKEIFRILKPGGKFIWTTPCGNKGSIEYFYSARRKQIESTKEGYIRWKWEDPTHLRRLKSKEIEKVLLEIGYNKVFFRFRSHFFSFVCTKLQAKGMLSERWANRLMLLDYKMFRVFSNAASMIGCATK